MILNSGYTDLSNITMSNKEDIIRGLFLDCTIYRTIAELDQLTAGLNVLGIADEMEKNPSIFRGFFTRKEVKLSAGKKMNYVKTYIRICCYI